MNELESVADGAEALLKKMAWYEYEAERAWKRNDHAAGEYWAGLWHDANDNDEKPFGWIEA
jgi:hypothetical protein